MVKEPLVSIIVVSYNHAKYIEENLTSIKNQTYKNIELIVADDASSDNSVEVFEKWLSDNNYTAKKKFHKKNTGLATTLNECIEMVNGKFVKFIAADDFLEPRSIEECVKVLEAIGDEVGMVFTDFITVDESSHIIDNLITYKDANFFDHGNLLDKNQLLFRNVIIAPTALLRTTALKATGPYISNFILEDHDRWLRINELYRIGFVNEKLANYRVVDSGVTSTRHDRMVVEDIILKLKYDKKGINSNFIDWFFVDRVYQKKEIPELVLQMYKDYPFNDKLILFGIKHKWMGKILMFYKMYINKK